MGLRVEGLSAPVFMATCQALEGDAPALSSNLLAALRAMTREMALGTRERHRRWQQVRVRLAAQGFTNISDPETVGVRLSLADWEALLDRLETHP